jgi:hypothetical protein
MDWFFKVIDKVPGAALKTSSLLSPLVSKLVALLFVQAELVVRCEHPELVQPVGSVPHDVLFTGNVACPQAVLKNNPNTTSPSTLA